MSSRHFPFSSYVYVCVCVYIYDICILGFEASIERSSCRLGTWGSSPEHLRGELYRLILPTKASQNPRLQKISNVWGGG